MKKRFNKNKLISKKSVILVAVSLVLVIITAVGTTASWIEEVSQVDFNSNDGQQTPLHVGSKKLNSDTVIKQDPTADVINLSDYFYKSGDMHLSPCYGDGEKFYFPVENGTTGFREGTKDDVNVNYMSATFRVRSEGEKTAYWFEKSGENNNTPYITFGKQSGEDEITSATNETNAALMQYLRCSVTIDGTTNVYALNDTGKFKTVDTSKATPVYEEDGRRIDEYTFYQEAFNNSNPEGYYKNEDNEDSTKDNVLTKPNQGGGENLNGNTLFIVNKYDSSNKTTIKTVTVKIWLEYNNYTSDSVDVASINMNFVSSWAKTRRVYVKDATVYQDNRSQEKWLSTYKGTLFFALKDNLNKHWLLNKESGTDYYYADIPAVYNNSEVVFLRCGDQTNTGEAAWGKGDNDKTFSDGTNTIKYWNIWTTSFPDTFHSEVYTVYSSDFATWEDASKVNRVYFINSQSFSNVYSYMWDSASIYGGGINEKVVKNADWPGVQLTTKMKTKTNSQSFDPYPFFFNADYDYAVFSDGVSGGANKEFQTQDLLLKDRTNANLDWTGKTFDMATLTWFDTAPGDSNWNTRIPEYSNSNIHIRGDFVTGSDRWVNYRFAWGGQFGSSSGNAFNDTSSTHMLCKIYIKQPGEYKFKLNYMNTWYGAYKNSDQRVCPYTNYKIDNVTIPNNYDLTSSDNDHQEDFRMEITKKGIIRIYFDTSEMKLYFADGEN